MSFCQAMTSGRLVIRAKLQSDFDRENQQIPPLETATKRPCSGFRKLDVVRLFRCLSIWTGGTFRRIEL